jgi:phosphomevalonate kinase
MTEIAGQELASGDIRHASETLKAVQSYSQKIHMGMAEDTRKLKNAEILMRHTAFRLKEILYNSSLDDRPTLESTLKQLDQVQTELMLQVFKH